MIARSHGDRWSTPHRCIRRASTGRKRPYWHDDGAGTWIFGEHKRECERASSATFPLGDVLFQQGVRLHAATVQGYNHFDFVYFCFDETCEPRSGRHSSIHDDAMRHRNEHDAPDWIASTVQPCRNVVFANILRACGYAWLACILNMCRTILRSIVVLGLSRAPAALKFYIVRQFWVKYEIHEQFVHVRSSECEHACDVNEQINYTVCMYLQNQRRYYIVYEIIKQVFPIYRTNISLSVSYN